MRKNADDKKIRVAPRSSASSSITPPQKDVKTHKNTEATKFIRESFVRFVFLWLF